MFDYLQTQILFLFTSAKLCWCVIYKVRTLFFMAFDFLGPLKWNTLIYFIPVKLKYIKQPALKWIKLYQMIIYNTWCQWITRSGIFLHSYWFLLHLRLFLHIYLHLYKQKRILSNNTSFRNNVYTMDIMNPLGIHTFASRGRPAIFLIAVINETLNRFVETRSII